MKRGRSLYDATIAMEYPEEKRNDTIDTKIENKIMP